MEAVDNFFDSQLEEKRIIDSYGVKYFTDVDINVCNYVARNIECRNFKTINPGNRIEKSDLYNISLNELSVFGDDIISRIKDMLFDVKIIPRYIEDGCQLATGVSFVKNEDGIVDRESGQVDVFVLPQHLYEISSLLFGHEIIHAMKDTNYDEYIIHKVLGETIPIFYELMIYNPDEMLKKEVLRFRMNDMVDNGLEYDLFNQYYKFIMNSEKTVENIKMQDFSKYYFLKKVCYLNSFYYALILYNMYKENPSKILNMISRVLKQEITTLELLEQLGIYGDIRGFVFEKEMNNIRKLIK